MTVESTIAHDAASLAAHININGPAVTPPTVGSTGYEFYSTYWVSALAYLYNQTSSAAVLSACNAQWDYVQTLIGTGATDLGFWRNPAFSTTYYSGGTYLDHHGRYLMDAYAAYKLLDDSGQTALAAEMLAAVDAGMTALMDVYPAGNATVTGNAANQPLRDDSTPYEYGDVVRLSGGKVLWCSVAGTSGTGAPIAPGAGNTVADGTITWTQERTSFRIFPTIVTTTPAATGATSPPNQHLWWAVPAAAIYKNADSAWYGSAALLNAVNEHVEAAIRFQLHKPGDTSSPLTHGMFPRSMSNLTVVSSVYNAATCVLLALIMSMLGSSPRLVAVLRMARDFIAANFETKPDTAYSSTAGWYFSGAESDVWSGIVYRMLGDTYPHADKMFTNEHHDAQGDYTPAGEYGGITTDVTINDVSERGYCNLAHEAAFVFYTIDLDVLLLGSLFDLDVLLSDVSAWHRRRYALLDPFTPTRL